MIDYFALALMHGLIAVAVIRLLRTDALDREPEPGEEESPEKRGSGRWGRHA